MFVFCFVCFFSIPLSVIVCICSQAAPLREWLVVRLAAQWEWVALRLKWAFCLSKASFAHLAMTDILKGMGVSGGRLFLDSFFFGGTKKNEYSRGYRDSSLYSGRTERKSIYANVNSKFTKILWTYKSARTPPCTSISFQYHWPRFQYTFQFLAQCIFCRNPIFLRC